MFKIDRISMIVLAAALGAVLLVGCKPREPEVELEKRVQEFWDAKVQKNWSRAYTYLEPAWREVISLEEWIQGVVEWHSADVTAVLVKGRRGAACVRFEYEVLTTDAAGEKGVMQVEEPWILVRGAWYRKEVPRTMKPPLEALGWDLGDVCGDDDG